MWSLRSLFLTSPSPTQEERNQALFEDAEKGDLRSVDALLRGGERKSFEATHWVPFLNGKCLCTTGAWPDAFKSDNGFTAIVAASANGHDKIVSRLLEGGTAGAAVLDQQTRVRALAERPLHLSLLWRPRLLTHTNPLPILPSIGFREYIQPLQ